MDNIQIINNTQIDNSRTSTNNKTNIPKGELMTNSNNIRTNIKDLKTINSNINKSQSTHTKLILQENLTYSTFKGSVYILGLVTYL